MKQKERKKTKQNRNGNKIHPRHPRHSQSFCSSEQPHQIPGYDLHTSTSSSSKTGRGLWWKADLDNNSLQLWVTVLRVCFPKQPHKSLINLKLLIFPVTWKYQQRGGWKSERISSPTPPHWYQSVIYFVIDFIQFSLLLSLPRPVLCGEDEEHVCPLFSETAFVVEGLKFITGQERCM